MCDGSNVYCSFKAVMNTNTILRSSKGPPMKWEHQLFLLATKPQSEGLQLPLRLIDALIYEELNFSWRYVKKKKSKFCSSSSSLIPLEFFFLFGHAAQDVGVLVPQSGIEPLPPTMEVQSLNHAGPPGKSPFWILGSWILSPQFKNFWTRHSKWHQPAKKPSGQVSSNRNQEGNAIEGRGSCRKTPPERLSRLQPNRTGTSEPDRSFPAEMDIQFANLS